MAAAALDPKILDPKKLAVIFYKPQFASQTNKKEKLTAYFEDRRSTGGGEIAHIQMNEANNQAFIYFRDEEVCDRVVNLKKHAIDGFIFTAKGNKTSGDDIRGRSLSTNRGHSPPAHAATAVLDPEKLAVIFYKPQFASQTNKKEKLTAYFEDRRSTGGGEIAHIQMNEANNQAFIYFIDEEARNRVVYQKSFDIDGFIFTAKGSKTSGDNIRGRSLSTNVGNSEHVQVNQFRRSIIIDGNNVAISHGRGKVFSCKGLVIAIKYFTERGHTDIQAVVPRFRQSERAFEVPTQNPEILQDLNKYDFLIWTPSKIYDDEAILQFAIEKNAVIVSNDRYRDFLDDPIKGPYLKDNNLLEYSMSGDTFCISTFPFGKNGPSLEETLTRQSGAAPIESLFQRISLGSGPTPRGLADANNEPPPSSHRSRNLFENKSLPPAGNPKRSSSAYQKRNFPDRPGRPNQPPRKTPPSGPMSGANSPDNLVSITHAYLYNYCRDTKNEIEKEFQVRLKFLGAKQSSNNQRSSSRTRKEEDESDDSDSSAPGPDTRQNRRIWKTFQIKLNGYHRCIDTCKQYLETLNDNFCIIHVKSELGRNESSHVERLVENKVKRVQEEEEENSDQKNENADKGLTKIGCDKSNKTNKISVFVTSTDPDEVVRLSQLFRGLEAAKREVSSDKKTIQALISKIPDLQREFNVRIFCDKSKNMINLYHLNTEERELDTVLERIMNIDADNKFKVATISSSSEKMIVAKHFKAEFYQSLKAKLHSSMQVHLDEAKKQPGVFILKSANQKYLDQALQVCANQFKEIARTLQYRHLEFPFALHECLLKHKGLFFKLKELNVGIKTPKTVLLPTLCLSHARTAGLKMYFCQGNIVNANTCTIVNSLNQNDQVAQAISEAAGEDYEIECQNKPADGSQVFLTTAGKLNAQSIMNVLCSAEDLKAIYELCINKAIEMNYQSIAIPLLGHENSRRQSVQALINVASRISNSSLKEIYVVENDQTIFKSINGLFDLNALSLADFKMDFNFSENPRPSGVQKKWYWMADSQWTEYTERMCYIINKNVTAGTRVFLLNAGEKSFLFDLDQEIQVNKKTNFIRKISDHIPITTSAQWYWLEDRNVEQAYGVKHNQLIEEAFQAGKPHIELEVIRHKDDANCMYRLDFSKNQQINLTTSYVRKIVRKEIQVPAAVVQKKEPDDMMENADPTSDHVEKLENQGYKFKLWLVGKENNIAAAHKHIVQVVKSLQCTTCIDNQSLRELTRDELIKNGFREKSDSSWLKNGVRVIQDRSKIILDGLIRKDVEQVKEHLYRLLLNKRKVVYPEDWYFSDRSFEQVLEIFDVKPSSPEWTKIEKEFKKTLTTQSITRIQRIQNRNIYKYYFEEKNYLADKKRNSANQVYLWHGTRLTEPQIIYSSDKCGFDFHHSNEGLWGRGLYFARNASYSYNYAFKNANGDKQMFFCSVLLGESSPDLPSDRSLRMPPLKDPADPSSRYDSVRGSTNNSEVFIVYDNQKVYPAYLVSFKDQTTNA